ncbi:hypothetical protein ACSBL2_18810 [Pedobacter sp. AW31-3R]|uniref:hypothetical protein n=1 Tax=Pedobacter sp. AW31-3R TaxID=3445781 RepID=UPI003FA05E5A
MIILKNLQNRRKVPLIAGVILFLISVCFIFPIEYRRNSFLEEFVYTYSSLALALFLMMFGLMGRYFFKGILFLVLSSIVGAVFFYVAYPLVPYAAFIAVWLGIPSGIIAALIFMVLNFYILNRQTRFKLLKQIAAYLIILLIVSVLFGYGGDWFF